MNRIFISYRTSDGRKDAARLATDLNERFGEPVVFYDKQDLVGGRSWRDAINATLGSQPVVLALVTPDLLGAEHPEGGRRIDREDDPIRGELLTARNSGAVVMPLLVDGMQMPPAHELPEVLRFLTEAHARRLRTDDWNADLQRIEKDLAAHRILPAGADPPGAAMARGMLTRLQRGLMYAGVALVGLLVLGWLLPDEQTGGSTEVIPAVPGVAGTTDAPAQTAETADAADPSGVWWSVDPAGHRTRVQITLYGEQAHLQTDAVPVAWYPEWQAYAQQLRAQGTVFDHIEYSATGQWAQGRLSMTYDVKSADGHGPLDTGTLSLTPAANGRELLGQLWSNGEQAHTPLRLVRR